MMLGQENSTAIKWKGFLKTTNPNEGGFFFCGLSITADFIQIYINGVRKSQLIYVFKVNVKKISIATFLLVITQT